MQYKYYMSNWTQPGYDPSQHGWRKGVIEGAPYEGWSQNYFFADTLRSIDIAFGLMIHGISVFHTNKEGEPVKQIEVPIKIGPRQKAFDFRVDQKTGKKYYIPLPNITYRRTAMEWDGERAQGRFETRTFYKEYEPAFNEAGITDYVMINKFWSDIQPIPYKLTYEVVIKAEYQDDLDQLNEQLARLFQPDYNLNVKEFWFAPKIRRCIKVTLTGQSYDYATEFQEQEKRELTCTMTFNVDAWLYKPIKHGYIIDQIITTLRTVGTADHEWQQKTWGNYDGSLDHRYKFSDMFGTKIGYASALIPESTIPKFNPATQSYLTKYEYEQLEELTNYPVGAKQLYLTSAVYDKDYAKYAAISAADARDAAMSAILEQYPDSNGFGFVSEVKPIEMPEVSSGASAYGGFIFNIYKDLSGFGQFRGPHSYGFKDAVLGTDVVKNAPYMSSAGILHEDK